MKRARLYLALGAAAGVGFGVLYLVRPNSRPSHGVRIVYALDRDAAEGRAAVLDEAVGVVRARLAQTGVESPSVARHGETIVVELPGVDDEAAARVRWLLDRPAKLEFAMVAEDSRLMRAIFRYVGSVDAPRDPVARGSGIEGRVDVWNNDRTGEEHVDYYLTARDREEAVSIDEAEVLGCGAGGRTSDGLVVCRLSGRAILARYLADLASDDPTLAAGDDGRFGYEYVTSSPDAEAPTPHWRTYYLEHPPRLDDQAVAGAEASSNTFTDAPEVTVRFTPAGTRAFAELTAAQVGHKLAVVLDDQVAFAPIIQGPIRGGTMWIPVGEGTVTQQRAEARALAAALRAGPLPAPLREESVARWGTPPDDP